MLIDALAGLAIGAFYAGVFALMVWSGLERLNQGLASSLGFLAFLATCLWLDGWIVTGIVGFAAAMAFGLHARAKLR
ncbi:MAG: hypothetical protein AAF763_10955 [Pseudomonadota bacterium]